MEQAYLRIVIQEEEQQAASTDIQFENDTICATISGKNTTDILVYVKCILIFIDLQHVAFPQNTSQLLRAQFLMGFQFLSMLRYEYKIIFLF
jgi:hypothetical protein